MPYSGFLTRYTVTLTHDGNSRNVEPIQDDILVSFVEESGQEFLRERIDGGLIFTNANGDYAWLLAIENGANRCLPITVEVIKTATDEVEFFGTAYLKDAEFDLSKCRIRLKVESHDEYTRLFNIWEKPINILDGTDKVCVGTNFATIDTPITEIETESFTTEINLPLETYPIGINYITDAIFPAPPLSSEGWVITYYDVTIEEFASLDWVATRDMTAQREITLADYNDVSELPGGSLGSWVPLGTPPCKFYRKVSALGIESASKEEQVYLGNANLKTWYFLTRHIEARWVSGDERSPELCNGMTLETVFNKYLDGSGLTIRSNLFNINPSGSSPSNDIYDGEEYHNVTVFQVTDIKLPDATEAATIQEVSLKDFLTRLYNQFQVRFSLDGTELVVEHVSYFDNLEVGIDLATDYPQAIRGKEQYSYKQDTPPKAEVFYHDSESLCQLLFRRWDFSYEIEAGAPVPQNCAPAFGATAETVAQYVCNDVQSIFANPDNFSDELMVFVNCFTYDGDLYMDGNAGQDFGVMNIRMSPGYLRPFWYYRRWFYYGQKRNRTFTDYFTFESIIATKIQTELEIPIRNKTDFDSLRKVTTTLGTGRVLDAKYSFKTGRLKLRPIFE